MLGSASMMESDMPADLIQRARGLCASFEDAVAKEVERRKFAPAFFAALLPCNLLCLVDSKLVTVVFTSTNTGGLPRQIWRDWSSKGSLSASQVLQAAVSEMGFLNPSVLYFDSVVLGVPDTVRDEVTERVAKQHVEEVFKAATRPKAISGYEGLQPFLDAFSEDHPSFEKNVFIAMRFRPGKHFVEIHDAIKTGLAKFGLKGLRVDDKTYPPDGDLWNNICVYMMGCKFGSASLKKLMNVSSTPTSRWNSAL
jgi:hypothetical protein